MDDLLYLAGLGAAFVMAGVYVAICRYVTLAP